MTKSRVTLTITVEVDDTIIDALPAHDNGPHEPPTSGIEHEALMQLSELSHQLWNNWRHMRARLDHLDWSIATVDDDGIF